MATMAEVMDEVRQLQRNDRCDCGEDACREARQRESELMGQRAARAIADIEERGVNPEVAITMLMELADYAGETGMNSKSEFMQMMAAATGRMAASIALAVYDWDLARRIENTGDML